MLKPPLRLVPALILTALAVVGCQPQQAFWEGPGGNPVERDDHRPRSIVTDHPALTRELAERPDDGVLPWYADRKDYPLATEAGVQSPVEQYSATRTIDRRHESRGRVYDTSTQTTYRYRVQRSSQ